MSENNQKIQEYLNNQSDITKKLLNELRKIILEVVPDAEEITNYGILAFTLIRGGKAKEQIMIAGFKNHIGLYPTPDVIEHFADQLKDYKISKGAIQFPLDKPLPKKLIKDIVTYRLRVVLEEKKHC